MNATFNFAHQVIAGLDNQIADCAVMISELEAKLAQVRETQKALENERQAMLTLAKAGESAIEQAATFLTLAKAANRDDMVQAFWNGIDALRDEKPQLPPVSEPSPEPSPEPSGDDVTEAIDTTATIEATEATEVTATTEATDTADTAEVTDATDTTDTAEKPAYHSLSWREFLSYAKAQGINTKGKTRAEIELELLSMTNQ